MSHLKKLLHIWYRFNGWCHKKKKQRKGPCFFWQKRKWSIHLMITIDSFRNLLENSMAYLSLKQKKGQTEIENIN